MQPTKWVSVRLFSKLPIRTDFKQKRPLVHSKTLNTELKTPKTLKKMVTLSSQKLLWTTLLLHKNCLTFEKSKNRIEKCWFCMISHERFTDGNFYCFYVYNGHFYGKLFRNDEQIHEKYLYLK